MNPYQNNVLCCINCSNVKLARKLLKQLQNGCTRDFLTVLYMVLCCIKRNNLTYIFTVGIVIKVLMELVTEYFHYLCDVFNYLIIIIINLFLYIAVSFISSKRFT